MSLVERALKKIQARAGAPNEAHTLPTALRAQRVGDASLASMGPEHSEISEPKHIVRIDRERLRGHEILPPPHQERRIADDYRQIKRPLIERAFSGETKSTNVRVIMTASALPGDGKTFTSVNLALSMALEKDVSVLLIDADVAKPHISELLGITAERGLLDALRDEALSIESMVLPTDVPGLSVLSAGTASSTATELLASSRMERILEELCAHDPKRIMLLDSPPLLLTTESRVLAAAAGQVVLIVKAGVTPQQAVLDALDLLGNDKSVGLVLNQSDEAKHAGYYEYYGRRASAPTDAA